MASVKAAPASGSLRHAAIAALLQQSWAQYVAALARGPAAEVQARLAACQLVGASASVHASRDVSVVGKSGVVLWATAACVHLLTEDDRLVSVPRNASELRVALPADRAFARAPVLVLRGAGVT